MAETRNAAAQALSGIALSSASLLQTAEQRGRARQHYLHGLAQCRSELGSILDRTLRPPAHRLGELAVVEVGILDARADGTRIRAVVRLAVTEVRHPLH